MRQQVTAFYFSPTGGTEKVARHLAGALSPASEMADLSDRSFAGRDCSGEELAIFVVPVFMGRIPTSAAEAIRRCRGDRTPAVAVVVFGNRAFDDALAELCDLLEGRGFLPVAAGAFVAEHSKLRSVASGRPDGRDLQELEGFAGEIVGKLALPDLAKVAVPGNRPCLSVKMTASVLPVVSDACVRCRRCAQLCPAGAIPLDAPNTTAPACIGCMRCIMICPQHARNLPAAAEEATRQKLGKLEGVRCENRTWL